MTRGDGGRASWLVGSQPVGMCLFKSSRKPGFVILRSVTASVIQAGRGPAGGEQRCSVGMSRPLWLAWQHCMLPVGSKERRSPLKALELGLPQVSHLCPHCGGYCSCLPLMDTWGPKAGVGPLCCMPQLPMFLCVLFSLVVKWLHHTSGCGVGVSEKRVSVETRAGGSRKAEIRGMRGSLGVEDVPGKAQAEGPEAGLGQTLRDPRPR